MSVLRQAAPGSVAVGRDQRRDEARLRRVHDWIGNELRVFAYARRRGCDWWVVVPAFSIAACAASLEVAFARANALLIEHFASCVCGGVSFRQARRPLAARHRLALAVSSIVADGVGTIRRRPPQARRVLVTARSLELLPVPSVTARLDAIRRSARMPGAPGESAESDPAESRLASRHGHATRRRRRRFSSASAPWRR
jgi:hypothetical protein